MIGEIVSHYRIVEKLGGGGMGVVYKARDLRLDRFVALKFLPPDLTRDEEANKRFMQEAKAASALDHPHICTIHEIDETPTGQVFITMAFYDGETLKKRIEGGPLVIADALQIAIQVTEGLARAHGSGIVHRDIKPANVMLTADGLAKIVDFGVAKLRGETGLTRTGSTVGTVSYMPPEQMRGQDVDQRADIWAVGVVLYEMLTGERPFRGDSDFVVLNGILNDDPRPIKDLRPDVPPHVQRVVSKALEKPLAARYQAAADLLTDLTACAGEGAGAGRTDAAGLTRVLRRPVVAIPTAAALVVLVTLATVAYGRSRRVRWAREQAIPQIMRLIEADDRIPAFALAEQAERDIPKDPVLATLWPQVSAVASLVTVPEGATASMQEYGSSSHDWRLLGQTPIKDLRLPRGVFRFKIEKDGYETLNLATRNPGALLQPMRGASVTVALLKRGSAAGMVPVPGGAFPVPLTGFNSERNVKVDAFLIDQREVTNKQYKQFIDAGGYSAKELAGFHDSTSRPGPLVWELGQYSADQADYPVGGVSWFEAAAYCQFRGKTLPTLFHWARAAMSPVEIGSPLAPAIVPLSNFSGKGPAAVGSYQGSGPYGTSDMAGNVREWVWNEAAGGRRWILGGAWNDPTYMFNVPYSLPPSDRSATNGFRCAKYDDAAIPDQLLARTETASRDYRMAKAVSNEVFDVFKKQLALVTGPLNARVDWKDPSRPDWIRERISFDAGYDNDRATAVLFVPKRASPPYQLAVQFPGASAFSSRASSERLQLTATDYIVKSGRAFVFPIWKGSFERWDPFISLVGDEYMRTFRTRMFQWRQDLGRLLDVLAARGDIDMDRIAYFGNSFGSSTMLPLLALEERFKTAVLIDAGFTYRPLPAEADAVNYVGHVTVPVIMLNGRHDYIFPLETAQIPLLMRLGTPADQKRHVVFEAGHSDHPRGETIREVLAWLDRHLGPVRTGG
jgi:formylglycine-generating enzyme required for sulfatase activity